MTNFYEILIRCFYPRKKELGIPWNIMEIGENFSAVKLLTGVCIIISVIDRFLGITFTTTIKLFRIILQMYTTALIALTVWRGWSPHESQLFPLILFLTMTVVIYKYRNSGLFSLSWTLVCVSVLIRIYMDHSKNEGFENKGTEAVSSCLIWCIVYSIETIILKWSRQQLPKVSGTSESPQNHASFLSLLTYHWVTPLIFKGYSSDLKMDDLYPLIDENRAENVISSFEKFWNKETKVAKEKINIQKTTLSDDEQHNKPSLLRCICKASGPTLLISAVYKVVYHLLDIANPFVLKLFINMESNGDDIWTGFMYAFLMFVLNLCKTLLVFYHIQKTQDAGRRNWVSLTSLIYKKTLKLSNSAKKSVTVGEIVNLMSVDVEQIGCFMWGVNDMWIHPLLFCVVFYLLWNTLGYAVVYGILYVLVLMPVVYLIAQKRHSLHRSAKKLSDARIKQMNEILNGIKVLKMYAWEESFQKQILLLREEELKVMKSERTFGQISYLLLTTTPSIMSALTFGAYVYSDSSNIMSADRVFVCISLFRTMHWLITVIPHAIKNFIQARVSLQRLQSFMNSDELDPSNVIRSTDTGKAVTIENGTFSWSKGGEPTIKSVNLTIPTGQLVAVVGSVGSGKSSLLSAILGEMESKTATVKVNGSIAYGPQQAWIMNDTLQNNILFGKDLDKKRYQEIIESTALSKDLEILANGDQAEIGEKGINISGGQKQRVSLARAVYQEADIYLLDDPLSAVDSHVGKHIFDNVIGPKGILSKKTRILVTHGLHFLKDVDLIITMVDGSVGEMGTFDELLGHDGPFAEFLKSYMTEAFLHDSTTEKEEVLEMAEEIKSHVQEKRSLALLGRQLSDCIANQKQSHCRSSKSGLIHRQTSHTIQSGNYGHKPVRRRSKSIHLPSDVSHTEFNDSSELLLPKQVMERQWSKCSHGSVDMSDDFEHSISVEETTDKSDTEIKEHLSHDAIRMYLHAVGLPLMGLILLMSMVHEGLEFYLDIWLKDWTKAAENVETEQRGMRIGVYSAMSISRGILIYLVQYFLTYGLIKASRTIHDKLLKNTLRLPMAFFDTNPVGRIVNRFSKDVEVIDNAFIFELKDTIISVFCAVGNILVVCSGTPQMILVILPMSVVYFYIQRLYVKTSRQIRKLESAARSPVYSHFSETITGAATIRAFQHQNRFAAESAKRCDNVNKCNFLLKYIGKWLHIRLDSLGAVMLLFACVFVVLNKETLSPGTIGLVIAFAMNIPQCFEWIVGRTAFLETNSVSVERIKEYCEAATEAKWIKEENRPGKDWPDKGMVVFDNLSVSYGPELDLVLKGLSFQIKPGEKIGIVGRTGAGKSSLTMALFRILERTSGHIYIDGIDIADIGLYDLRSKLTIIPQDPVLFAGTIRMNLDPFDDYTDDQIWEAIHRSHLYSHVSSLKDGLAHVCSEGGDNLSVGQRQLVCLARALLRKTKILILDEATAAVDLETDDLIQKTIRTEFKDSTVLTIAHRLNTIVDYNRIMVLDSGTLKEFDSPKALLDNTKSVFYGMAKDAGLVTI